MSNDNISGENANQELYELNMEQAPVMSGELADPQKTETFRRDITKEMNRLLLDNRPTGPQTSTDPSSPTVMTNVSEQLKDALFAEQQEGYEKSLRLADIASHTGGLVSLEDLKEIFGAEAIAKALAGGTKVLTCSDGRVQVGEHVRVAFPGICALLPEEQQAALLQRAKEIGVVEICPHHPCGACKGDKGASHAIGAKGAETLGIPMTSSGYEDTDKYKMTGDASWHEELGFVISEQPEFNAAALGMERHMMVSAFLTDDDAVLNEQAQKLLGILMGHGWGPDGFKKRPMTFKVVGLPGDARRSARALQKRLQPTWDKMNAEHPGAFNVVLFDAPHVAKR